MTWTYTYQPAFVGDLKSMEIAVAQRVVAKLDAIRDDPLRTMKRLKGSQLFSLRVGDYRLHARVYPGQKLVDFIRVGHRRSIHDR